MTPARQDLSWYRGDLPSAIVVTITADDVAVDLTGSTFVSQVRRSKDADVVLATLTVDNSAPATGVVRVEPSVADTEAVYGARAFWDLEWVDAGGVPRTPVAGEVTVSGDVTRV